MTNSPMSCLASSSCLKIDREGVGANRAQKALDDLVRKSEQREERYRKQEAALQAQVGDLRHQVGILKGNLSAGWAENQALGAQLERAQRELVSANAVQTARPPAKPAPRRAAPVTPPRKRAGRSTGRG
ncbi:hypothetical protein [Caballeronia choica]|uniref:hypothetical protein n=1 Tax=Caballeronia choica TaxID=326476 RepID=UPI000AA6A654|nr:hypothetical protein [Caballeronia choica]